MTKRHWPIGIAAVLAGSMLAIVSGASGLPSTRPVTEGCTTVGCVKCEPVGCMVGPGGHLEFVSSTNVDRCVDYDHTPPAHCATVVRSEYNVFDQDGFPNGNCYNTACGTGNPTSEECDNPWTGP